MEERERERGIEKVVALDVSSRDRDFLGKCSNRSRLEQRVTIEPFYMSKHIACHAVVPPF